MVFSSQLFLFYFLPLALGVYYVLPRRARHLGLTALSYVFYGWASPWFALLLAGTTLIDYVAGLVVAGVWPWSGGEVPLAGEGGRPRRARVALAASIVGNLGVLAVFKYANFAAGMWGDLAAALGLGDGSSASIVRIALPLGISFYTFQSLSYTIDVYRGRARATRNLIDFACFVSMFPQLVAGPIIRYREVADQLAKRTHSLAKFSRGLAFVSMGLAKKVLLANPCGRVADWLFATPGLLPLDAWYGAVAYGFQIYFDFSGYSDMAIGLGLMLGFMFAKNFDSPYRAASITEFWRRWHLSLSTWLRDYLYIPLGGNRFGPGRTYVNIAIVMLLGGLWHGAAWTFVAWGAIHGALLIAERLRGAGGLLPRVPRPVAVATTFVLVTVAWVFFRSPSIGAAWDYCGAMLGLAPAAAPAAMVRALVYQPYYLLTMAACAGVTWLGPQTWDFTRGLPAWKLAVVFVLLWAAMLALLNQAYNPFIYFIF